MADSEFPKANSSTGSAVCEQAIEALRTYAPGSGRAALLPIDQAVAAALKDPTARRDLEMALVGLLREGGSAVAREYVASKLALIGSSRAVPALTSGLGDPKHSTAARTALQAIPADAASKALRKQLGATRGLAKIGVINSLAARRDARAVAALTRCLRDANPGVADAATAALGEIGTAKAARALVDYYERAPQAQRRGLADALLACAARLARQGNRSSANDLLRLLLTADQPVYIRQAAEQGMRA